MKIKNYKKLKNNTYKIVLEDSTELLLYDEIILKYNLLLKKEIYPKEIKEIIQENNFYSCYFEALRYLSYKNRSKKEIKEFLIRKKYTLEDVEKTVELLENKKYINEEMYLKVYIQDQIHLTNNGPNKIIRKLINLGFLEEKIKKELQKVSSEIWKEKLEKIITKKIQSNRKDGTTKIKEKIYNYCLNEGFFKEDILESINRHEMPQNIFALQKEAERLYNKLSLKFQGTELLFQIKGRLARKGFSFEEIETVLEEIKKSSQG